MNWIVAWEGPWLAPFVPGDRHQFDFVVAPQRPSSWHARKKATSGLSDWKVSWDHASAVWKRKPEGVITLFPHTAAALGMHERLGLRKPRIIAYNFNLGQLYGGLKGTLARFALRKVDRFVVHARRECRRYADWLGLPAERFRFVHYQTGAFRSLLPEDQERPFILAMGSAHRDYRSFFEAVRRLNVPTVVVAASHALQSLEIPPSVEVRSGLTLDQCRQLAQRARISVVPLGNDLTASGQVTVAEAMRMGRPVVATRCIGTEDYIDSETNGLLVPLGSPDALTEAIGRLWEGSELRRRLADNARQFADQYCSDEAAGVTLGQMLDELSSGRDA